MANFPVNSVALPRVGDPPPLAQAGNPPTENYVLASPLDVDAIIDRDFEQARCEREATALTRADRDVADIPSHADAAGADTEM